MNILRRFSLAIMLMVLCGASAFAQLTISGSVTDSRSGKGLSGVTIKVKGSSAGAYTDRSGSFKVVLPNLSQASLVFNYVGYKTTEVNVDANNAASVAVKLEEDVLKTSEVVVTGISSSIKKANSPNSIGTINERELLPAPAQTVDQAFAGKFAGISIRQNTGAPGGGVSVTLRGATTLIGGSQPLYIVDGVIMNNSSFSNGLNAITSAASGSGIGAGTTQEQTANRIADLNPNDIEDIQVLKGPSAAAAYGAKAASGVIIIKTKQGKAGKTQVTVSQQLGFNEVLRTIGLREFKSEAEVAEWNDSYVSFWRDAQAKGATFTDHEKELLGNKGLITETNVNVSGGSEFTQFSLGGTMRKEDGIIKNTGYERYTGRLNLNHSFNEDVQARIGVNYMRNSSRRGASGNSNNDIVSIIYSLSAMPTFMDLRPQNGVYPKNPLNPSNAYEIVDKVSNDETVNRTLATLNLNWKLWRTENQSLEFVVQGGADFLLQDNLAVDPPTTLHQSVKPNPGVTVVSNSSNVNSNLFLTLVHRYESGDGLSFTTQGGVQFENQISNTVQAQAQGFAVGLDNLNGSAVQSSLQTQTFRYDRGFFLQEDIDLFGKIFISASLRGDQSSANGNAQRFFLFPKVGASIQLSQYDFWESMKSTFPQFKVRLSYGEAGTPVNTPNAKYTLLSTASNNLAGLGSGLAVSTRIGNPDIRPERTGELEAGLDFTVGSGFALVELSFFQKNTTDLILSQALPLSSGYGSIFKNVGDMKNTGFEASVSFNAVQTDLIEWRPRINFFTNKTEITRLEVPPFNAGGFGLSYGANRVQQGAPATAIFGRENIGPTPSNPTATAGQWNGTIAGNSMPDFQIGFANTLKVAGVEFYFLVDVRQGGHAVNLTQDIFDETGGTGLWKDPAAAAERLTKLYNTSVATGGIAPYIQDVSFVKVREMSLSYTFDKTMFGNGIFSAFDFIRVGIAGRNVFLFTKYESYDPEVSNFGNIITSAGQDVTPFPSSRAWYANISVGF